MCTDKIIFATWAVYVAAYLFTGYMAYRGRVERAPGIFWQFRRESYNEIGWKWHKAGMWMFAGALPFVLLVVLVANRLCRA